MKEVEKVLWHAPNSVGPHVLEVNDFITSKDGLTTESLLVHFGPGDTAANHRHAQYEVLVGFGGKLYLVWKDGEGRRHEEKLTSEEGSLYALVIAPHIPHLIENRSKNSPATMQVWNGVIDNPIQLTGEDSLLI